MIKKEYLRGTINEQYRKPISQTKNLQTKQ